MCRAICHGSRRITGLPVRQSRTRQSCTAAWRWVFAICAVLAFYTDVLVTIAQIFKKVPALGAPTASNEPQFIAAQLVLLAIVIWLCVKAYRQFRPS